MTTAGDSPVAEFLLDRSPAPVARLLLAHGAGAPADSAFLSQLAGQLALLGIEVWRFNFAYMAKTVAGQKQPPARVARLQDELLTIISRLPGDLPLFIGGKSMGGRVATLFSAEKSATSTQWQLCQDKVAGVLVFGYPFCPPAKKTLGIAARVEHFPSLGKPLLIVQGERDEFGGKAELGNLQWPSVQIKWLADGNHDLATLRKHRHTQAELIKAAASCSADFVRLILDKAETTPA